MKDAKSDEASDAGLVALFQSGEHAEAEHWSTIDLAAMLSHQLETPLAYDLQGVVRQMDCVEPGTACRCTTFGDLLRCPHPAPKLLRQMKAFAKRSARSEGAIPEEIARFIYVASVLRARVHRIEGVSDLSPAVLAREVSRCLTMAWLPENARQLLRLRPHA